MSDPDEEKDKKREDAFSEEEEQNRKKRYKKSMMEARLFAFKQRAENAGIPKRFVAIGPKEFSTYLCPKYHNPKGELDRVVDFIYKKPLELNEIPFIIIDGGDIETRKKASFAIMFRLITCDNFAKFVDCRELAHKLNTFDPRDVKLGEGRNDYADDMKEINILTIGEFRRKVFNEHCEGGDFLDEILDERVNQLNPTIITFQEPMGDMNKITDNVCGHYMATASGKEVLKNNPSKKYLRIRVRKLDDE
jgi:hypothetical protein